MMRLSQSQATAQRMGTADTVTSDVVNSWTNGTFTAGQVFLGSGLTFAGVGALTPAAARLTDFELVVDVSASCNNLIVLIWTEGTAAQNVTLDHAWNLLPGDWSAGSWPYVNPRHTGLEKELCRYYYRGIVAHVMIYTAYNAALYHSGLLMRAARAVALSGSLTVNGIGAFAATIANGDYESDFIRITTASTGLAAGYPCWARATVSAEL